MLSAAPRAATTTRSSRASRRRRSGRPTRMWRRRRRRGSMTSSRGRARSCRAAAACTQKARVAQNVQLSSWIAHLPERACSRRRLSRERVFAGHESGEHCPAPDQPPCNDSSTGACADCKTCVAPGHYTHNRPSAEQYQKYLPWFLASPPSASCAKGGLGVYSDYIERRAQSDKIAGLRERQTVTAAFRSFSAPLATQRDFTAALAASHDIVDAARDKLLSAHHGMTPALTIRSTSHHVFVCSDRVCALRVEPSNRVIYQSVNSIFLMSDVVTDVLGAGDRSTAPNVYVYSIFHPFFQQYLHIARDATFILSTACAVVFAAAVAFTGSARLGGILALTLSSLLLNMLGCMALLGVQLNAMSLVNLAMSVGIGLEFVVHIAQGFLIAQGTRCVFRAPVLRCRHQRFASRLASSDWLATGSSSWIGMLLTQVVEWCAGHARCS
jgi:Patched family